MTESLNIAEASRELKAAKAILKWLARFDRSARERVLSFVINSSNDQPEEDGMEPQERAGVAAMRKS